MQRDFHLKLVKFLAILPFTSLSFVTLPSYSENLHDLLKPIPPDASWSSSFFANKTAVFNQTSGDASQIAKMTLTYFTSADCSGASMDNGPYTTPDSSSAFPISLNMPFGLVAMSAWNVGVSKVNISDMSTVHSIAVVLRSNATNVPQADFSGSTCAASLGTTSPSLCCVPVTCSAGECISSLLAVRTLP